MNLAKEVEKLVGRSLGITNIEKEVEAALKAGEPKEKVQARFEKQVKERIEKNFPFLKGKVNTKITADLEEEKIENIKEHNHCNKEGKVIKRTFTINGKDYKTLNDVPKPLRKKVKKILEAAEVDVNDLSKSTGQINKSINKINKPNGIYINNYKLTAKYLDESATYLSLAAGLFKLAKMI